MLAKTDVKDRREANAKAASRLFVYKNNAMGYIAKGSITLGSVNDAYTISLSKTSCVINADFDGTNPNLTDAQTTIKIYRGNKAVAFDCRRIGGSDSPVLTKLTASEDRTSCVLAIISIPTDTVEGVITINVITDDSFTTDIQFPYSVVKAMTMLDWIQDWNGSKTKIGSTYIMTPKLFIGKKDQYADYATGGSNEQSSIMSVPGLTGVYIGPDEDSTGIYGYKDSVEIFHINNSGGMIGGWDINGSGIYSQDGLLKILSEGSIEAQNSAGDVVWQIKSDGTAQFALGNVKFDANGSASFKGSITSSSGSIGGWNITANQIAKDNICLDLLDKAIGVMRSKSYVQQSTDECPLLKNIEQAGGVAIYYTSNSSWGLVGYSDGDMVTASSLLFSLGTTNKIASWNFDKNALWSGTKNNTAGTYTTNGITIGSSGMRGLHWYIDNTGSISFMDGQIQFSSSSNSGNIVGWMLNNKRFSTDNVAIVSDGTNAGIYMSAASGTNFNTLASSSLLNYVSLSGGICMKVESESVLFIAYDNTAEEVFKLRSDGESSIANWNIEHDALYIGTKITTSTHFTTESGSITLSNSGIRGYKWRFEADGSGALAGDKITWDSAGNMTINASLSANNITSGTISTADIKNSSGSWYLKQDGSGVLANGNITWNTDGALSVSGEITASSGRIGDWYIVDGVISSTNDNTQESFIKLDASQQVITVQAETSESEYFLDESLGAIVKLDANNGIIEARAKNAPSYSTAVSFVSSNGIFSNIAAINAMPSGNGYYHYGAIVGIGYSNLDKRALSSADTSIVAGVYGRASNEGTADAYGGFFYQLKGCGVSTSTYYFTDAKDGAQLDLNNTAVIGLVSQTCTLYLPTNAHEGQIVEILQMGSGKIKIDTNDGTHIYDDDSENDYYECSCGECVVCKKVQYAINGTNLDIWITRRYKY